MGEWERGRQAEKNDPFPQREIMFQTNKAGLRDGLFASSRAEAQLDPLLSGTA